MWLPSWLISWLPNTHQRQANVIDTRQMHYTGEALVHTNPFFCGNWSSLESISLLTPSQAALKHSGVDENLRSHNQCEDSEHAAVKSGIQAFDYSGRVWTQSAHKHGEPKLGNARHIGKFALTSEVAPWVMNTLSTHKPSPEVLEDRKSVV